MRAVTVRTTLRQTALTLAQGLLVTAVAAALIRSSSLSFWSRRDGVPMLMRSPLRVRWVNTTFA